METRYLSFAFNNFLMIIGEKNIACSKIIRKREIIKLEFNAILLSRLFLYFQVLAKNKYLCMDHYDEAIFDFHCVDKLPAPGTDYYTICGTPFPNHAEYIVVVCGVCFFGFYWFLQLLTRSYSLPRTTAKKIKQN